MSLEGNLARVLEQSYTSNDLIGCLCLARMHQVLHILKGVVFELSASFVVGVDHVTEAIKIFRLLNKVLLHHITKDTLEIFVDVQAVRDILFQCMYGPFKTMHFNLLFQVVKFCVARVHSE